MSSQGNPPDNNTNKKTRRNAFHNYACGPSYPRTIRDDDTVEFGCDLDLPPRGMLNWHAWIPVTGRFWDEFELLSAMIEVAGSGKAYISRIPEYSDKGGLWYEFVCAATVVEPKKLCELVVEDMKERMGRMRTPTSTPVPGAGMS